MAIITIRHKGKSIKALYCNNHLTRGLGLMFREKQAALIELPFESLAMSVIHTFFMRFSIDIYWLDSRKKIIGVRKRLMPFSLAAPARPAKYILEAPAGKLKLKAGEKLNF